MTIVPKKKKFMALCEMETGRAVKVVVEDTSPTCAREQVKKRVGCLKYRDIHIVEFNKYRH